MNLAKSFVMDAAQYIIEPPDLWSKRVPSQHKDSAPKVIASPEGGEAWSCEAGGWQRPLGLEVAAGHSPVDIKDRGYSYADIRKGMFDAKERVQDMQIDEVDAASIFPTFGMLVRSIRDVDLHLACVRAYNDGLWEWAQEGDPRRLVPQALAPTVGFDAAMTELQRLVKMGYRGIVFGDWPAGGGEPQASEDPFWALCEEAGVVISLLRGGPAMMDRLAAMSQRGALAQAAGAAATNLPIEVTWALHASINNLNLSELIFSGILDRFPKLQVAVIDAGAGWLPQCGELLDWNYRFARFTPNSFGKIRYQPSDYIRRQVKVTVKDERSTIESRHDVGVGALMWSSNYPNSTSSWPTSRLAIEQQFREVPKDERRRMLGENCAELYGVVAVAS